MGVGYGVIGVMVRMFVDNVVGTMWLSAEMLSMVCVW